MIQSLLVLLLTVWFDGVPVECVVDTGAAVTVLSQSQAHRLGTLTPLPTGMLVKGVGSDPVEVTLHSVPNVGTEDLSWPSATLVVLPDEALGSISCLLGMNLLGQQPVAIDWRQQRLRASV